jgi:sulfopyruvate decarboxylase subunit alpha
VASPSTIPSWARAVSAGLHACGCRHVVYVPDNPLSSVLDVLRSDYPDIVTTLATREEEAFGIAAGLYLGGARPAVMLQSSGLGNSINAIASLVLPYQIPVLAIVSMRGEAGEWNAAQMPMGRALAPILDALGVSHATAESPETTEAIVAGLGRTVFGTRQVAACLLPRRLTVPEAPGGGRT